MTTDDPAIRIVEVDEDSTAYEKGHIPGAAGWNWFADLHDPLRRDYLDQDGLSATVRLFRGLFTFPGHVYKARDEHDLRTIADEEADALLESAAELSARGIPVREMSIGSTPTSESVRANSGVTEMRPGSYVYGDAQQVKLGSTGVEDCALAVIATVVATPAADRAVLDAGSKALSADVLVDGLVGYGLIVGRPDLVLERMGEEHGMLVGEGPTGLRVGDRLAVIPTHCCTTVNLHDATLVVRGDGTEWDPVAARGWRQRAAAQR